MRCLDRLLFDKRVILVVGGASGMGAAAVELLRERGATVVSADINSLDPDFRVDISDEAQVSALVDTILERHGRLDGAANFAAIPSHYVPLVEISTEHYRRQIDVNLDGMFYLNRAEIRAMLASGGGSVVNVSSLAGVTGLRNMAAYSAEKHGVIGLTKSASLEYAGQGIRVNAVCPGRVQTPMMDRTVGGDEVLMERMRSDQPMNRLGQPWEVAEAALFLLSDAASFIAGSVLQVDGGVAARN